MAQKIRVFTLAREFGLDNEAAVAKIQDMGIDVRNYMSAVDIETAQRIRRIIQKERTENTVEEHIRPTVVRRRTKDGGPPKPAKKRPPKVEKEEAPKKTTKRVPKKRQPEIPAPALVKEETVVVHLPVEQPKPIAQKHEEPPVLIETVEKKIAEPQIVEVEPVQPEKPASPVEPEEVQVKKVRPYGIEIAARPQVLRPSTEAPIIKRRITVVPGRPPSREGGKPFREGGRPFREGGKPFQEGGKPFQEGGKPFREGGRPFRDGGRTMRVSPRNGAPGMSVPETSETQIVNLPYGEMEPFVPKSDESGGGRRGKPQRRREVESKEIAPSGRFTGIGPGKFSGSPGRKRRMAPGKKGKKTEITTPKASKRVIRIEEKISLNELARRMGVKATELLTQLMGMGVGTININSTLDLDTAKIVASDFGYEVENVAIGEEDLLASTRADQTDEEKKERVTRPPVITIMGHVDHGKTSLLDKIRKSDVVSTEAGGITQHIGAYRVKTKNGNVTFIDTPGHEAFTAMRARGANVTDVVVLVTAADDGVMPQTIEAISHARAAGVPIIVAINKCDLPTADTARTRRMLMQQNLVPEELGGDIIICDVSAKTGEGITRFLEMIALQAEVMELSANPKRQASGVVLEAYLDKGRGPVANILVQDGTLRVGEIIVAGAAYGKIRALTDEHGRKVKEVGPSTPVEVLGLTLVPGAGEQFDVVVDMKTAEKVGKTRSDKTRASSFAAAKPSLEALYEQMQISELAELKIILKTDVQGTIEALRDALEKLTGPKVKVSVVHASVGGITESDVLLASTANAIIIGFNVRPAGKAKKVAEEQGVEIRLFSIIYDVVDSVKQAMLGLLTPEFKEETLGQAEVRNTFTIPKVGTIAGSYVTEGKVVRNSKVRLIRDSVLIWQGRLGSLRRFKDDVREVAGGFECGISLEGYNDIKVGDIIEVFTEKEVAVSL